MQVSTDARPAAAPKGSGEVRSIQFLRGAAALGVLIFHAVNRAGGTFGVGAAGVDVFFVISGFIMWVVTCRTTPAPTQFLVRRAQRIIPLYWLVTLVTAAAALLAPSAFPAMTPTLGHVARSLLFIPHRDATGLIAPLIVPGWTLDYEIFFYLLFALGLVAPARWRAWCITGALIALVLSRPLGDPHNPIWATYTDPILLEFAAGLWLGWFWSKNRLPGRLGGVALLCLGLAGFAATAVSGVDVSQARILYWGLPAAALVTGAVSLERGGPIPRWTALEALGNASYSIYLVHGLAISGALRLLRPFGAVPPALLFTVAIVAGVSSGLVCHQLLEKPLLRLLSASQRARRPLTGAAARPAGG